jgi:hypothetical protein
VAVLGLFAMCAFVAAGAFLIFPSVFILHVLVDTAGNEAGGPRSHLSGLVGEADLPVQVDVCALEA